MTPTPEQIMREALISVKEEVDLQKAPKLMAKIESALTAAAGVGDVDPLIKLQRKYEAAAGMTPTQEQILKDALEIIATDEKTYVGHGDYYEGPFSGDYCQRVARKALTAAAGVGETEEQTDLNNILLSFTNYVNNERVRAYNEGVDATIECCAKWIDKNKENIGGMLFPDEEMISALKDKP